MKKILYVGNTAAYLRLYGYYVTHIILHIFWLILDSKIFHFLLYHKTNVCRWRAGMLAAVSNI